MAILFGSKVAVSGGWGGCVGDDDALPGGDGEGGGVLPKIDGGMVWSLNIESINATDKL